VITKKIVITFEDDQPSCKFKTVDGAFISNADIKRALRDLHVSYRVYQRKLNHGMRETLVNEREQ
jgi:hypothetical protein